MQQIFTQHWISLPKEVRVHLIKVFGIIRTGVTEIRDSEVVSDGHTNDDLKAISLEKMNAYIGSEETFARAWEITLAKVHSELNPPVGEISSVGAQVPVGTMEEPGMEPEPEIERSFKIVPLEEGGLSKVKKNA